MSPPPLGAGERVGEHGGAREDAGLLPEVAETGDLHRHRLRRQAATFFLKHDSSILRQSSCPNPALYVVSP